MNKTVKDMKWKTHLYVDIRCKVENNHKIIMLGFTDPDRLINKECEACMNLPGNGK